MREEVREVLKGVRELLTDPTHWTKGALARVGPAGLPAVHSRDPNVTCWCLQGALLKVADSEVCQAAASLLREKIETKSSDFVTITSWNDSRKRTHTEVLDLLDEVIGELS